jgi:cysteine synthase A
VHGPNEGTLATAHHAEAQAPASTEKNIVIIIPSFAERYLSTALFEGLE